MTTAAILAELRAQFKTPVIPRKAVLEMLVRAGFSRYTYELWIKDGTIKPLKNIPGMERARYLREQVLSEIEKAITLDPD